jgi:SAM-dependent methyltransferase
MVRHYVWDSLRRVCPGKLRRWIKSRQWFYPVSVIVFGNAVYSKSYYEDVERLENDSAEHIAEWVKSHLGPRRVLDVGCGPGHMMQALTKRAVHVFGVDISPQALHKVRQKGLACESHDLTNAAVPLPGLPYDLVMSCEVAEHLKARYARTFVGKLTTASETVYLTAAEPDGIATGLYHVNEQPNEYWVRLFGERGFDLEVNLTENARSAFKSANVIGYLARPMVFRKKGTWLP